MDNGEGDIKEIKELLQQQRQSHEGLKKTVSDTSTELRVSLKGLTTETKWVKWLLALILGGAVASRVIGWLFRL